jgi:hypothetical protein
MKTANLYCNCFWVLEMSMYSLQRQKHVAIAQRIATCFLVLYLITPSYLLNIYPFLNQNCILSLTQSYKDFL